jgi:ribosomal protein S18 acetylase RimI-like enzyme
VPNGAQRRKLKPVERALAVLTIRPTTPTDYAAVSALGSAIHSADYAESEECFTSLMRHAASGCFVADLDGIIGYVISFPYRLGQVYPRNSPYTPVEEPDCYYIHDLAVLPEFRGKGVATQLARQVLAQEWPVVGLVAVNGSRGFWWKLGFRGFAVISYGGHKAEYMLRLAE